MVTTERVQVDNGEALIAGGSAARRLGLPSRHSSFRGETVTLPVDRAAYSGLMTTLTTAVPHHEHAATPAGVACS